MKMVDLDKYRKADGSVDWQAVQSDQEWGSSIAGPNGEANGTSMWSNWGKPQAQQPQAMTQAPSSQQPSSLEERVPWVNQHLKDQAGANVDLTKAQAFQSQGAGAGGYMQGIAAIGNALNTTSQFWKDLIDDWFRSNPSPETMLNREAARQNIRGKEIDNASMMQEYLRNKRRDDWYRNLGTYLRRG